jgi:hypothetical protein
MMFTHIIRQRYPDFLKIPWNQVLTGNKDDLRLPKVLKRVSHEPPDFGTGRNEGSKSAIAGTFFTKSPKINI